MKLDSLQKLFVEELRDLYSAENQILKALPKMAEAASSSKLKSAFQTHLKETEGQVKRLEQIFESLGKSPKGKTCKAMEGLVKEGEELLSEDAEEAVLDAGLIAAAQRVEHYEMAGYGTVRSYAQLLGDKAASKLLQATLDEEGATDKKLTELAVNLINLEAVYGKAPRACPRSRVGMRRVPSQLALRCSAVRRRCFRALARMGPTEFSGMPSCLPIWR